MSGKRLLIVVSMLILGFAIYLNQFYHLPDLMIGSLMGGSIGLAVLQSSKRFDCLKKKFS